MPAPTLSIPDLPGEFVPVVPDGQLRFRLISLPFPIEAFRPPPADPLAGSPPSLLAKLSAHEQKAWRSLWVKVDALLDKAAEA
jgi:hypothetical protein